MIIKQKKLELLDLALESTIDDMVSEMDRMKAENKQLNYEKYAKDEFDTLDDIITELYHMKVYVRDCLSHSRQMIITEKMEDE